MKTYDERVLKSVDRVFILAMTFAVIFLVAVLADIFLELDLGYDAYDLGILCIVVSATAIIYVATKKWIVVLGRLVDWIKQRS